MRYSNHWILGGLAMLAAIGGALAWSGARDTRPDGFASMAPALSAKAKTGTGPGKAKADGPVVLELFTSQGCSSCPPADALAAQLARDPDLLVITRPVTYWDRLGWKDTLALEANTRLQRSYAQAGYEGAGVYTPQMVVNGRHAAVGSRANNIAMLVREETMASHPAVTARKTKDGAVTVTVKGEGTGAARLSLVALSSRESVAIGRGENGGRTVHYTNVLRAETPLGAVGADTGSVTVAPSLMQRKDADRYAVILRRSAAGPILAATKL